MAPRCAFFVLLPCLLAGPHALAQAPAAWQQRVHYEMDVAVDTEQHQMQARQALEYVNHSPDTLFRVFYHLYFNAFQPHSMMAERNRQLPDPDPRIVPRIYNLGPEEIGYHRIESLYQDGASVEFSIFDTVMKVELAEPIPPGGRSLFDMSFQSQIPLQTRRSGRDNREGIDYSMAQWYPKMANYDERGWHAEPYVGREFYSPYGSFDVRITLPSDYVVGSTGVLQNAGEIGHGYSEDAGAVDADSLTWHFTAENIHDFAWAADPDYVHDVIEMDDGPAIHLLYQPDVSDTWALLHEWGPEIISFFGSRYGPYRYPQMTIAQGGDGGMEYPMITLITGRRSPSSLLGVTAHEVAHMWFYGMIGSNEADYAWMDEGFTSYATSEVTAHIQGNPNPSHVSAHLGVLQARHLGLFERLNTPSDWFDTNFAYSVASYAGGEMILDMLGYVISDSLRDRFLLAYHDRFAGRHADPFGVEKVAEEVSDLQLDWYFEQFAHSTWELDYKLDGLASARTNGGWETTLRLKRKARSVMPVDLRLTLADGSETWVNIPLSIMRGRKPLPSDWVAAEPWPWTSPHYEVAVTTPSRVVRAEIDPFLRTPEANRLDNTSGFPLQASFLQPPGQSWSRYEVGWRPLAQYAHDWGFGGGLHARGQYLFDQYRSQATLKLWPEVLFSGGEEPSVGRNGLRIEDVETSALDGIDFDLSLSNAFSPGPLLEWSLRSRKHLGILQNDARVSLLFDPKELLQDRQRRLSLGLRHQHRSTGRSFFNHVSKDVFPETMLSAHARLAVTGRLFRYVVAGETGGALDRAWQTRTANRGWIDLAWGLPLGPFTGSLRVFAGTGGGLARHKQFHLGSAPFEDRWAHAAYRTIGGAFADPLEEVHWVAFEAPGPVAYLRPAEALPDGIAPVAGASNIAAVSARILTPRARGASLARPLRAEVFIGAGETWEGLYLTDFTPGNFVMDAGVGLRYDLSRLSGFDRWIDQSDVLSNLTLTARFPVWASDPLRTDEPNPLAFRWLVGVQLGDLPWH